MNAATAKPNPDSAECCRLANGGFEIIVSPATGRVIAYGPSGGPNLLWVNPRALETPVPFPGWANWGGDKVWIWPEEDWAKWCPDTRHPPGDPCPTPYLTEIDGLRLRMTSPVVPHYGLRIVRDISLDPSGSRVTFDNRLEQVHRGRQALPVGVWTVTQLPAPERIFARLVAAAGDPVHESFPGTSWPNVRRAGAVITLERPASPWQKIGLEADALAMRAGEFLFIAKTPAGPHDRGPHARCRRAQVFSDPDDSPFRLPGTPPYIEFEFTSPVRVLDPGESVSLGVTWQLLPVPSSGDGPYPSIENI